MNFQVNSLNMEVFAAARKTKQNKNKNRGLQGLALFKVIHFNRQSIDVVYWQGVAVLFIGK